MFALTIERSQLSKTSYMLHVQVNSRAVFDDFAVSAVDSALHSC